MARGVLNVFLAFSSLYEDSIGCKLFPLPSHIEILHTFEYLVELFH